MEPCGLRLNMYNFGFSDLNKYGCNDTRRQIILRSRSMPSLPDFKNIYFIYFILINIYVSVFLFGFTTMRAETPDVGTMFDSVSRLSGQLLFRDCVIE